MKKGLFGEAMLVEVVGFGGGSAFMGEEGNSGSVDAQNPAAEVEMERGD